MKNFFKILAVSISLCCLFVGSAQAKTYYLRTDGGTNAQCNGLSDKAYTPLVSDVTKDCAYNHPFWLVPPSGTTTTLVGGDTVIVGPGDYLMGWGAPNIINYSVCHSSYPWGCGMNVIPSGTTAAPTRILGKGWDTGCSVKPRFVGTERADHILNLKGGSNIQIQCLDITDGSDCSQNSNAPNACNRSTAPYGKWAVTGITAVDSSNVLLKNVKIHGLYRAVHAGRLSNWTIEDSDLSNNNFVGWDGDVGAGVSSNSGKIIFRRTKIKFSGCGEKLDGTPFNCISQSQGGYGDGLGTEKTSGDWVFDQVDISNNVSDGVDLLYHNGQGTITVTNSKMEANAGNQLKVAANTTVTGSVLRGTCNYFQNNLMAMQTWNGKAFDNCRAGGDVLAAAFRAGMKVSIATSQFLDVRNIAIMTSGTSCNGTEIMSVDGATTFDLKPKFFDPTSTSVKYYASGAGGNGDGPCGTLKLTTSTGTTPPPACVPVAGSCNAPTPACGQTTTGVDSCATPCTKTGAACPPACVSDPKQCDALTPAAGQSTTGIDNCGNPCVRTVAACPTCQACPTCPACPTCKTPRKIDFTTGDVFEFNKI